MSPQEFNALHIFHLTAVLLLVGCTFFAFAGAPETRKRVLMWSGIASLLVLLSGVRMWQSQFGFAFAGWILVKLVCWLAISAFAGIAYRRREKVGLFAVLTIVLSATAIAMAYLKPF